MGPATAVPREETAIEAAPDPLRRHFLLIALALFLALVAGGGLVYLRTRDGSAPKPLAVAGQAATAMRGQDAVSLKVTYFDQTGLDVTADLNVAKGGSLKGTLADSFGGKASYLAEGDNAAVLGDKDWWARRDPGRIGVLQGRWVKPKDWAFPMTGKGLDPEALAGMVEWVRDGGTAVEGVTTIAGQPVTGLQRDGWTVLFSSEKPYRLVWFGGPLKNSAPLEGAGDTGAATPPYVSGLIDVPTDDRPNVSAPKDVLAEEKTAAKLPAFDVTVNATTCKSVNCSWTVTVKNTGAAAAEASVIASVTPGMTTVVKKLGTMRPGDSVTTAAMRFPNPAPTNKDVSADYRAQVYTPALQGLNLKLMRQLQEKGLVPGRSQVLSRLDPSQVEAMLFTLDAMADFPKFDPDKAVDATENAVNLGVLPELGYLVRSRRLENPSVLYTKLQDPIFEYDTGTPGSPVTDKTGNRRQLQIAATVLRDDPQATLRLDSDGIDLLVKTKDPNPAAIQTKSISSDTVSANVRDAMTELADHAPKGSKRVVELYVDASAGFPHAAGRDYFDAQFKSFSEEICRGADEIVVVNQTGTERWTRQQLPGCR